MDLGYSNVFIKAREADGAEYGPYLEFGSDLDFTVVDDPDRNRRPRKQINPEDMDNQMFARAKEIVRVKANPNNVNTYRFFDKKSGTQYSRLLRYNDLSREVEVTEIQL